ncbi:6cce348a-7fe2-456a-94f1-87003d461e17 [Thermothielavioides terrestris]|uniref:6cce348a-7fe2-456a-94f1-87003d461e17 n=1 Tax=Thermothielavioides terrestris TaxID=2587410 RepID=A0A446BSF7_9PEZI|nr:6cce348a-7fe2-456a-94f1-87003d461e17 [Thermothielavioides terrestris]
MRVFKGLRIGRRSIKADEKNKPHISIPQKSAVAIVPPKKVIRALYDYTAQNPQELSFSRGDFFHVIGRENDPDWYEACNPAVPDARGLVPVGLFQALGRNERDSGQSQPDSARPVKHPDHDSGYSEAPVTTTPPGASQRSSKSAKSGAMVYGVVMYDFHAERGDELEAKEGEAIIVIAQSNPEWFVAKPIGRLGGPGLIPVSFVQIRDMATNMPVANPQEAVRKAGIPKVEEWKKMAADYKNSSITLGKFESGNQQQSIEQGMERMSIQQHSGRVSQGAGSMQQQAQRAGYGVQQTSFQQTAPSATPNSPLLAPVSAKIPKYCFAEDKYWFVIEAQLEDGRTWALARYYEDFYDFQIALLTEFPVEAGTAGKKQRTLPYMPGPVNYVTDAITEGRRHNLDAYVKNLLAQPHYISKCRLVKEFFAPRQGDYEIEPGAFDEEYRLSGGSRPSSADSPADGASRQSSRQNLSGGSTAAGYGGYSSNARQVGGGAQPAMSRQVSSLSQPSQSSLSPGIQQQGSQMKVKLSYHGEIIAVKVPSDISFADLYDKIVDRLKIPADEEPQLSYKDEPTGDKPPLMSDHDLDMALQRNEKLLVYVE